MKLKNRQPEVLYKYLSTVVAFFSWLSEWILKKYYQTDAAVGW